MLRALREFFDLHSAGNASAMPANVKHGLELAAAALLVEVTRVDGEMQPSERAAILSAIHEKFALSQSEAEHLLRLAEREVQKAEGYYPFTSLINRNFSQEQKECLIE